MTKRLFPVSLAFRSVVYAESSNDALAFTKRNFRSIVRLLDPPSQVFAGKSHFFSLGELTDYDPQWLDSVPWGEGQERTCREILSCSEQVSFTKGLPDDEKEALLERLVSNYSVEQLQAMCKINPFVPNDQEDCLREEILDDH